MTAVVYLDVVFDDPGVFLSAEFSCLEFAL